MSDHTAPANHLEFYGEDPDQAALKLSAPERIECLREYFITHSSARNLGRTRIAAEMHDIAQRWTDKKYKARISKSLNAENLRDFTRKKPSNLLMPSRLLVHAYVWIGCPAYRGAWGPLHFGPDQMVDTPALLPQLSRSAPGTDGL